MACGADGGSRDFLTTDCCIVGNGFGYSPLAPLKGVNAGDERIFENFGELWRSESTYL